MDRVDERRLSLKQLKQLTSEEIILKKKKLKGELKISLKEGWQSVMDRRISEKLQMKYVSLKNISYVQLRDSHWVLIDWSSQRYGEIKPFKIMDSFTAKEIEDMIKATVEFFQEKNSRPKKE